MSSDAAQGTASPFAIRSTKILVALICVWNLWMDRGSLRDVPFFNDSAMHEQMVRFATRSLEHFHLPFTQWYSLLNDGSPQFLHYQGLGATIVGALGIITTPNVAFRLSLYLMIALWPLAIYLSSRIFGLSRYAATAAALASPFLSSSLHLGYEGRAFEWVGYGVWAQLCASWALPFAWAWTWRALHDVQHAWKAMFFVALTAALHFETGYAAFGAVFILPFILPSDIRKRLLRAGLVLVGGLLVSSWVIVPLLLYSKWAAINTGQEHSAFGRGYGAKQNFHWLFHGTYFDQGRFPIITILVGIGLLGIIVRWLRDPLARALGALGVLFFLLSFGPTTWGSLIDVIPGHSDIFFRRFIIPVDLAALYIVGFAVSWLGSLLAKLYERWRGSREDHQQSSSSTLRRRTSITLVLMLALVVALIIPSGYRYQNLNNRSIGVQLTHEASEVSYLAPILDYVKTANDGRVYAGLPSNWGQHFMVGLGPMYMYLADNDVDQISTEAWAASLMEEPQELFNQSKLSDYEIFAVRYLLLPYAMKPPIHANLLISSGPYRLWQVPNVNYFSVVLAEGNVDENKFTIARQSDLVLSTLYFEQHVDFRVHYGTPLLNVTLPTYRPEQAVGRIESENINLLHGSASGIFDMRTAGNVVLSASFDPGWQAFVDGQPVPTQMVAPALVSVPVPAGVHQVVFRYQGFRWYLPLWLLAIAALYFTWRFGRPVEVVAPEATSEMTEDETSKHDE